MKKVILITGASSGIGLTTALELLAAGHTVYGAARRVEKMASIQKAGGMPLYLDITDEASILGSVRTIIEKEGRIDALVNNAGYGLYGSVEETKMEDIKRQFEVNFFGLIRLTQLVLPYMRKQNHGRIINISSIAAKTYLPLGSWYHASKHALEGWSDCLRLEVKGHGIDVSLIEPGIIRTEFDHAVKDQLLQTSGNGPYRKLVDFFLSSLETSFSEKGSDPKVIADLIKDAVESQSPKIRYVGGKMAKPILLARKLLSDRWVDRAILSRLD